MREIEFRGKSVESGEWVYCLISLTLSPDNIYIATQKDSRIDYAKVIPETIGQYTGLLDKNGVKIFEGDIVSHEGLKKLIRYFDGSFIAKPIAIGSQSCHSLVNYDPALTFEVIGNIYDNPELIGAWI